MAHRYSRESGFANPTVWCEDMLKLIGHIRSSMARFSSVARPAQIPRPAASSALLRSFGLHR